MGEAIVQDGLNGRRVALPETRKLDVLAGLLERRGAKVLRYPLVSILDTPDQAHVEEWLRRFITDVGIRDLILLTGEGLRRLVMAAERFHNREAFVARLAQVRTIARGPKPGAALRELGLTSDVVSVVPTTEGVIAALKDMTFESDCLAVQLYGSEPNLPLQHYLSERCLTPLVVAPYVYASASDEDKVLDLVKRLSRHEVDAITFTSQPQVRRLFSVAEAHGHMQALRHGLADCTVAAIGPVVGECLVAHAVHVDAMPDERYFMRPLVDALASRFAALEANSRS